jgi:dsRNA-specific ribonuclease
MNEDYGDTERLAELGAKVLELTVTNQLFLQRPLLPCKDMQDKRAELISDAQLDTWLKAYGLKEKFCVPPNQIDVLDEPEEMRKYFNSYLGALYIRNGLPTIQEWISRLIDPNVAPSQSGAFSLPNYSAPNRFGQQNYGQSIYAQQNYAQQLGYVYPAPPPGSPPPLPTSPPPAMPLPSMSLVTLALVNQTAAQKGFTVTYPAEQVGPPHQPTWTVKCFLNGQERGRGIGKSQKIAKEEAARQAWAAMRWGPS